ncbi:MAG TPA: DNA methyltransferase [Thermoplasmata archaeon]|nr:DNA methyltransferase [Thermoplasmata archaeon]
MAGSDHESLAGAVREVLGETGAIGATVRQIASRLDDRADRVATVLDAMRSRGDVLRMGRGLFVLRDYERLAERHDFVDPQQFAERFEKENGVTLGRYRGPITFRSNESLPVHRWWPYVQGYSAEFVAGVIAQADLPYRATVLDPFAGSGTTLVEARRAGAHAVGTELLGPAALAARVKTHFELDPRALPSAAERVLRRAARRPVGSLPFLRETRRQFSSAALRDLTRLRDALPREVDPLSEALRLAFGRILIPSSRLHRSPCLGYGRAREEPAVSPMERFRTAVDEMVVDLGTLQADRVRWGPPAEVTTRDARHGGWRARSVALAVTSPPYVNGMDYVMNYKVDLAWLGYAHSYADLAAIRRAQVACDNLPRREAAAYLDTSRVSDPWLSEVLSRIRENLARKGSYRRDDMHAVVHRYFSDLRPVLDGVYRALVPGGRFVVVVGDSLLAGAYVPGDLLLARLGAERGFRIASVEVARRRRSGQRRSFELRESIVTLERPRGAA